MRYRSTRDAEPLRGFSGALETGLAPDGGLFVPLAWPAIDVSDCAAAQSLPELAARFLAPFAAGDPLAASLPAITAEAFDFPAPVVPLTADGRLAVLELFHGPTAAFKDFGARFLAACLTRLRAGARRPLEILVATSGDTGGAVAAAFHRRPGVAVTVLFPKGLVSPTQEQQLTCWGANVRALRVRGTFDDCQRLVKAAFVDPQIRAQRELSSANSINLGRLLPQAVYYAWSSLAIERSQGAKPCYVIPSGNLGNAVACVWARHCGFPIGEIVLAHNANRTVPDFLAGGTWQPRRSIATLASAMDVGDPSNMERLRALHPGREELRAAVSADSVDDEAIRRRIRADFDAYGRIWCPHTATAAEAWARLPAARRAGAPWVLVATAHPAKFREIVEPVIGRSVALPPALARLFELPVHCVEIEPELAALRAVLD